MNLIEKKEAVAFFGDQTQTAKALSIDPAAVSMWPKLLSIGLTLKVIGAAMRESKPLKKPVPKHWLVK